MLKKWLRWFNRRPRGRLSRQDLGAYGETLAESELRKRGYRIIERNYRCKLGEIDIVCKHAGEIVIVEVKTRASRTYGSPQDSITATKARKLIALGSNYLAERRISDAQWRIDVVAIMIEPEGRPRIEVIPNAVQG